MRTTTLHRQSCHCTACQPGYLAEQLAARGERATTQRQAVWDSLARTPDPHNALELAATLADNGIGQATVYRTLELFTRLGLVRRATLPQGRNGYAVVLPGHCHALICDHCGRIEEFSTCSWNVIGELLELKTGFNITSHHLEVHGVCPDCQHAI